MNITIWLWLLVGLAALVGGAEMLVRGASRLASAIGVSPLLIGLTVVAFGTSSPELAVSIQAARAGQADIAVANVVGSNIFNVLFILGSSALIAPLVVSQRLVRIDTPLMIGVSALLLLMSLDGKLGWMEGAALFTGVIAYTFFCIRESRKESSKIEAEYEQEYGPGKLRTRSIAQTFLQFVFIVAGLGLLMLGARWLVGSATAIAQAIGVSELVIGLTIVAVGTSLPEAATSVVAAIRGERDIAIGNVVGSNIFNILLILGVASLVSRDGLTVSPSIVSFDLPVMIAVAVACLPIFFTGNLIARWEGAVFLAYYVAYTSYLVLNATRHDALPLFSAVMWWFVLPLTVLTISVVTLRAIRDGRRQMSPSGDNFGAA